MIVHPVTGEKLDISSTAGRSVFKNYLKFFNTGGSFTNITVPNKNLTGEKLSKFLAELNEEFKTKVGSDVDPTKLKEITGIVTGKIDELKGLITNSNFVSKTELQHVKGRLDSLTRPPKTTGITEDFLNKKLQNYFTKRSAEEEFGKQLNLINSNISNLGNLYTTKEELNKYFTTEKANALRTELENSIKAKTSSPTLETSADITVGELKKKLVDTGLFEKSEESEGIAFKKDKIQKGMNEQMLNKKLEEYKLIKGKAEDDDTYTATINNDMIQRIERRLKSLEETETETDTKESKSSGIDKNLRKILIEGDILEDDEDEDDIKLGNAFQSANLEDVFKYVNERTEAEPSTFGGADPPDIRTYKDNDEPVDRLKEPLREKDMKRIIDLIEEGKKTTGTESKVDDTKIEELKKKIEPLEKNIMEINEKILELQNKNKEMYTWITNKSKKYIDERDTNSSVYREKYLQPSPGKDLSLKGGRGRQRLRFVRKDNSTSEPIDTLQKPLTGTSLRELIDEMQFGPKDKQKTIKTIVDELNNKDDSKIDEKIETIMKSQINPIINEIITDKKFMLKVGRELANLTIERGSRGWD